MPLEIKELVIRATIQDNEKPEGAAQGSGSNEEDKEAIIEECVDKVLEILRNQKER